MASAFGHNMVKDFVKRKQRREKASSKTAKKT